MPVVLAPLLIELGVLLALVVAFGIALVYNDTLGALMQFIAAELRGVRWIGGTIARAVERADRWVRYRTGALVLRIEAPVVGFLVAAGNLVSTWGYTIGNEAVATLRAFEYLGAVRIPRLLRAAIHPLAVAVAGVATIEHVLERDLHRRGTSLAKWLRGIAATGLAALVAAELALRHTIAVDLPRALPGLRTRVRELEGFTRRTLARRLSRLEKLVISGAIAGLIVHAIARRLPWSRCSNVNRAGRGLCGMNRGLLDSLLVDTLLIAGSISIVEFARELQGFVGEVDRGVRFFVREAHDLPPLTSATSG